MINNPKISVVTITYGHENYIVQTLEGILMQNYPGEIEVLIANDNSPDDTDNIIKKYLAGRELPENFIIKYTKHDQNKGMMPNFIWALQQATGKYIALCEGDDYWIDEDKLSKQMLFFEKNKSCAFVFTGSKTLTNNGVWGLYYRHKTFKNGIIGKKTFLLNMGGDFCTASIVFDKKVIDPFPQYINNCIVGDFPLGLLAISEGEIGYIEDLTTVYRLNSIGSWSSKQREDQLLSKFNNIYKNMDEFNSFTNYKFSDLISYYKNEYDYKLIYRRILQNKTSDAVIIILKNLSIDFKKNYKMVKTLMWKFLKS
ncbi:glycosyltransferase [Chryseobacterium sp. KACC 21268]|nr:glycosyltransferase [Chryseobacterium sp. KACC 21268]